MILSSQDVQDDATVEQYFGNVKGMAASMKLLTEWSLLEVANRLTEMGRTDDVLLSEYRFFYATCEKPEISGE